jgi:hypothetical protein
MRKTLISLAGAAAICLALVSVSMDHMAAQGQSCGGSFVPSANCIISGLWNFTNASSAAYPVPFQVQGAAASGVISKTVDIPTLQC